ncbi:MAG: sel1 repeat family protein [Deltaproteobacteria bacterium]|jgi:TPR repeat protein|nr:sel1 repeat family protein [Deltaproteobacteria bacterium]
MADIFLKDPEKASHEEFFELAEAYHFGKNLPVDYEKALEFYHLSADRGHTGAQFRLYDVYFEGKFVRADLQESFKWLFKAASSDLPEAQLALARAYESGQPFGEKKFSEALGWFTKAADQGNSQAQLKLFERYLHGHGVDKDLDKAAEYWRLAGHRVDGPDQDLEFIRMAADQGDRLSQRLMGSFYARVVGVEKDLAQAIKFWRLAADQGDSLAQYNLAMAYFNGLGVEKNIDQALIHCRLAADQGDPLAVFELIDFYEKGFWGQKDRDLAVRYFKKAAKQGYQRAKEKLLEMGLDPGKDPRASN